MWKALVHTSQITDKHIAKVTVLSVGDEVKAKILEIKPEEKRISLSIREAEDGQVKK